MILLVPIALNNLSAANLLMKRAIAATSGPSGIVVLRGSLKGRKLVLLKVSPILNRNLELRKCSVEISIDRFNWFLHLLSSLQLLFFCASFPRVGVLLVPNVSPRIDVDIRWLRIAIWISPRFDKALDARLVRHVSVSPNHPHAAGSERQKIFLVESVR